MSTKWGVLVSCSRSAMRYPEIPVLSTIVAVLLLVPLPSQLRARNIPTVTLILNMFLVDVVSTVNALVWNGNTRDVTPAWCDFASTISICWGYSAIGACICICKHLEWITSSRNAVSSRRHKLLFEVTFCLIIPLMSILIRYILARSRYIIVEDFGCQASIYDTAVDIALMLVPQLILSFVGFIFACFAARNLIIHKITTQAHNSTSILTTHRSVRLLFSCVIIGVWPLLVILLSTFFPWIFGGVQPWPGWIAVHRYFYNIPEIAQSSLTMENRRSMLRSLWYRIISGFLIFYMFIFTEDVRNDLARFWDFLIHTIPRLRRCSAAPPLSPKREALGRNRSLPTPLVIDISVVKTQSGESSSTCEHMSDTSDHV